MCAFDAVFSRIAHHVSPEVSVPHGETPSARAPPHRAPRSLINDIHPENGLIEPFNATSSPCQSDVNQATAPIANSRTNCSPLSSDTTGSCHSVLRDSGLSWHDAEDAKQAAIIEMGRAWNMRRKTDEPSTKAWIRKIVKRVAITYCCRSKRQPKKPAAQVQFDTMVASGGEDPTLDELIGMESQERMAVAINDLPEVSRQVVELKLETDKTIPEIADELGCSPRTVNFRLAEAREALWPKLLPLAEEESPDSHGPPGTVRWRRRASGERAGHHDRPRSSPLAFLPLFLLGEPYDETMSEYGGGLLQLIPRIAALPPHARGWRGRAAR